MTPEQVTHKPCTTFETQRRADGLRIRITFRSRSNGGAIVATLDLFGRAPHWHLRHVGGHEVVESVDHRGFDVPRVVQAVSEVVLLELDWDENMVHQEFAALTQTIEDALLG